MANKWQYGEWAMLALTPLHCQDSLFLRLSPISICSAYTVTHLESSGAHILVPMKKPELGSVQDGNEVCDECSEGQL